MAQREIVTWPAAVLKGRCDEVERFDAEFHELLDDMRETMVIADGLGLAANQVGVSRRAFVMAIPNEDGEDPEFFEVVNPVIDGRRGEHCSEEGCLSFPGISESVLRAETIDLAFRDRNGNPMVRTLGGLAAVCAQHEFDHLEGITFVDRLSPLKRRLALRAYRRERRAQRAEEREKVVAGLRE